MKTDMIQMRLHEVERVYYDPRADLLAGIALDDEVTPTTEARLLHQAEEIFRRARASHPRTGSTHSVRAAVVDVLRRFGGAA